MRQFASITADILARKGEARPWDGVGAGEAKRSLSWEQPVRQSVTHPSMAYHPVAHQPVAQPVVPPSTLPADIQSRLAEQIDEIHHILAEPAEPTAPPPRIRHARAEPIAPPPKIIPAAAEPVAAIIQRALAETIAPELPPVRARRVVAEPVDLHASEIHAPDDLRKCTVKISHHDYERLGILAVKQGKSRQRLLQETVNSLFTGMTQEFGNSCQCLGKCD
jgi:hypothetical protein